MPDLLKVGLDVSPLALTRAGTARYVRGLLGGLSGMGGVGVEPLSFPASGRAATLVRDLGWYPFALPRAARRRGVDVLHCTTFRAPLTRGTPMVVTFHDLAVLRLPRCFNLWSRVYGRHVLQHVARASTAIIAVSEFTRQEVVELLGVHEERVHVVPNGVGVPFIQDGPAASGEYVLAVSTLEPRKNLNRLVRAFQLARMSGCELRVVGARGWGGVDVAGARTCWLGTVTDEELASLYRGALCVAYVSLYEGFGLPVLEAMACGTPVVVSTASALKELGGDAVVTVDPRDPEAIAQGLEDAISRSSQLRARGLERAQEFTWQRTAVATSAVYHAVAA